MNILQLIGWICFVTIACIAVDKLTETGHSLLAIALIVGVVLGEFGDHIAEEQNSKKGP